MIAAPSAVKCPRRGGGRNGACGVATRWRKRHPCPRPPRRATRPRRGERGRCRVGTRTPHANDVHATAAPAHPIDQSRWPSAQRRTHLLLGRFFASRPATMRRRTHTPTITEKDLAQLDHRRHQQTLTDRLRP